MSRPSLYEQALGEGYKRLPIAVQRFHSLTGHTVLHGWVITRTPESLLSRCLAIFLGAPLNEREGPLKFELDAGPDAETWTRHFPTRTMTSRMRIAADKLEERLGAATLVFKLRTADNKLSMELVGMRFLGVPCPGWLMPQVTAEETGDGERLNFQVTAVLRFAGTVASYRGHLDVPGKEPP